MIRSEQPHDWLAPNFRASNRACSDQDVESANQPSFTRRLQKEATINPIDSLYDKRLRGPTISPTQPSPVSSRDLNWNFTRWMRFVENNTSLSCAERCKQPGRTVLLLDGEFDGR